MTELPTGTVTFLFTDIEGSTSLAQQFPAELPILLARHHAILHQAIQAHNGHVFQITGDAFCAAFYTAGDALKAALDAQRGLQHEAWNPTPIRVRMGLHTGAAQAGAIEERAGRYVGYLTLTRVQRVMSAAHGGQVLLSNPTVELVRGELPADVSLRDMGEHRLKGLLNPERLWQLVAPDVRQDFPPLQSLNEIPNNLPVQLTSFIGREKDIAEVKRLLSSSRLVTLTGSGGAGKTRLSLQVAAEEIDDFAQGVWFVELGALTDPGLIPQTVASVLGLREEPGRLLMTLLTDYLRAKTAMIILDNCEHLIEGCAQFADTLLRAASQVKILASSREAFNIGGEATYRVPSLAAPDPRHVPPLEALTQYDAVRLFIERAKAVMPSFEVNDANAPAVAQLCYHLDGIPLAIELAAARVRGLKVEQIAQRLDDRFRLLTGGGRTALPRHQTLRATIDWSHGLLTEQERILFRRLSVFVGGWTIEAAEAVCAGDEIESSEVVDLLLRLVDKSLIWMDERSAETRYHMLETIREYAREKLLETSESEQIYQRHFVYFLEFAETGGEAQWPADEYLQWCDRMELELGNLRAALGSSQEVDVKAGLQLAGLFGKFSANTSYFQEGLGWLRKFLALPETSTHTVALATALLWTGVMTESLQQRRKLLEESLAIYRELSNSEGIADAYFLLGRPATAGVDWEMARASLSESLRISEAIGDKRRIVRALSFLGQDFLIRGDTEQARKLCEESARIHRESGMRSGLTIPLGILGNLAFESGDLTLARAYYEESLALYREINSEQNSSWMLLNLSQVAARQGNFDEATGLIERDMALWRRYNGADSWLGPDFSSMAFLEYAQGDYQHANEWYKKSLPLLKENPFDVVEAFEGLARTWTMQRKMEHAVQLFGAAAAMRTRFKYPLSALRRAEVERDLAALRTTLNEDAFDTAWNIGQTMTLEQAIEFALGRGEET